MSAGSQVLDRSNPPFYRWFPGPASLSSVGFEPCRLSSEVKQCKAAKHQRAPSVVCFESNYAPFRVEDVHPLLCSP